MCTSFNSSVLAFWGHYQSDQLLLACRELNLFLLSNQLSGVNGKLRQGRVAFPRALQVIEPS